MAVFIVSQHIHSTYGNNEKQRRIEEIKNQKISKGNQASQRQMLSNNTLP
jgi:hypothetical protein